MVVELARRRDLKRRMVLGFHAASLALRDDYCGQNDTLAHVRADALDSDRPLKLAAWWDWKYRLREFAAHNLARVC